MQVAQIFVIAVILVVLFCLLLVFFVFFSLFRPWLRAFLSGVPISLFQLIGMKIRKSDANLIVTQGIAVSQAGFPIPWVELERAYLQQVDLKTMTLAYITARERGENFTFQKLVAAEQATRTKV